MSLTSTKFDDFRTPEDFFNCIFFFSELMRPGHNMFQENEVFCYRNAKAVAWHLRY